MITSKAFFPVLITDQVAECKEFFVSLFGFQSVFDSDWYLHLVHANGAQLGFLVPGHPSQPSFLQSAFAGSGLVFAFEVESVDEAFDALQNSSADIVFQPKTEEWGQRHFMIAGPGGVTIDVVQNVDPSLNAT